MKADLVPAMDQEGRHAVARDGKADALPLLQKLHQHRQVGVDIHGALFRLHAPLLSPKREEAARNFSGSFFPAVIYGSSSAALLLRWALYFP